ncbi:MAG: tRNA (adenosine(37)-N6)-threonylcarbamoyltransferase complex dimerization subunit type 1 TsaB [Desulfobacterales bacterium]|jgi:tRNA threonylcarbamoyladenosine biosynthesis protein TsaB|nr:tRNA (adenosine(37)-N6)-threonylcarbamoyltransferase complex dimerization subunit type 1 TsaB [Desulfobacterales bacterium]
MRILAMDTASGCGSVAVADGNELLSEMVTSRRETHSRHLMTMVDQVLQMAGLTLHEMDGFAVTVGPGSFTGLRIGISTMKGLALVTQKPVAGISSLEALAAQASPASQLICPMLDARNREVYFARFQMASGRLERRADDQSATPDSACKGIEAPCLFVGDGALKYRELITTTLGEKAAFALSFQHTIRASTIWHLGRIAFQNNQCTDAAALAPRYLRRSYAESNKKIREELTGLPCFDM